MKVLFDENVPRPLRRHLYGHKIVTAQEMGWRGKANGRLLDASESNGFDVLVTLDQSLRHQNKIAGRNIAVILIATGRTAFVDVAPLIPRIRRELAAPRRGVVVTLTRDDYEPWP